MLFVTFVFHDRIVCEVAARPPVGPPAPDDASNGCTDVVKPKLARFLAAYPDIRIDLRLEEALANIVSKGFDVGIRATCTITTASAGE